MRKSNIIVLFLLALTFAIGCVESSRGPAVCPEPFRGPAYGQQPEIRRQIAETAPVKEWGYKISDVRLSPDCQKILVVFASPGETNHSETILENDGFGRYKGSYFSEERNSALIAAYESTDYALRMNNIKELSEWASTNTGMSRPFISKNIVWPTYPTNAGLVQIVVTLPDR
jgi:hypothetical protein